MTRSTSHSKRKSLAGDLFHKSQASGPAVNREPRVTVTIYFDATSSLHPVWAFYLAGLRRMFEGCRKHPAARTSAYVSVGLCGPRVTATPYQPFSEALLPEFEAAVGSPGGMWLTSAVKALRAEHERMSADGVMVNKDVFLFISDFHFDDGPQAFDEAVEAYRTLEKERYFNGFIVMAGTSPNRDVAERVTKKRPPVHLDELKIDELFEWMKGVIQSASMSRPGEPIAVPTPTWTRDDGSR